MTSRYRVLARRKLTASRQLRLRSDTRNALIPKLDDPMEMPSEIIDLNNNSANPRRDPESE